MPNLPTLDQVNAAMAAVNTALQDMNVPPSFETTLNNLSNVLQGIQDAVIEKKEQDLVDALAANNDELQQLNKQISDMCKDLDQVSDTIRSVSNTVGTVASVIGALV
jgi:ABC-type transporter Mla subunit MlaD